MQVGIRRADGAQQGTCVSTCPFLQVSRDVREKILQLHCPGEECILERNKWLIEMHRDAVQLTQSDEAGTLFEVRSRLQSSMCDRHLCIATRVQMFKPMTARLA